MSKCYFLNALHVCLTNVVCPSVTVLILYLFHLHLILQTMMDRIGQPCRHAEGSGTVASWLERSSPDQVVRVPALTGDIALCSRTRHLNTLTVPLFTQV